MKQIATVIALLLVLFFVENVSAQNNLKTYRALSEMNVSRVENSQDFLNHIYFEVWGYALVSANYQRLLPKNNLELGGGLGPNPFTRNFTLSGDGGMIISAYFLKYISLSDKFKLGFGIGSTYDFDGWYDEFWDPFFIKASLSRYSVSLIDDRVYYGFNLYYIRWTNWSLRPSIKLGFSF